MSDELTKEEADRLGWIVAGVLSGQYHPTLKQWRQDVALVQRAKPIILPRIRRFARGLDPMERKR